jgi:branched-chain amino acid transport system substrate-binding protein
MKRKILIPLAILVVIIAAIAIYFTQKPKEPETIKIGAILPLTGPASVFGKSNLESSQLLINMFNETSKIKLELIVEDSKSSPKDGINAYKKIFFSNKDVFFISSELSSVCLSLAPLTSKEGRILMAIAATPLLNKYKYVFRIYPTAESEALAFASSVKDILKDMNHKIVIFYINDEFGISTSQLTYEELKKIGFNSVFTESFPVISSSEIRNIVGKYKDFDLAIIIGYGQSLGLVIKEFRNINNNAYIISSPEVNFPDILSLITPIDEKIYFIDIPEPPEEIKNLYLQKFQRKPNLVDMLIFDGFNILFMAIKNQVIAKSNNININVDGIYNYIVGREFKFYGRTVSVDKNGNINYKLRLKNLKSFEK